MCDADAFHEYDPVYALLKSCERYTSPGMLPLSAQPVAHRSTIRIRSRVGLGDRSKFPTPKNVPPNPASRNSRELTGADHVNCVTRRGRPRTPTASGDTRAGSDRPGVAPVHARHRTC